MGSSVFLKFLFLDLTWQKILNSLFKSIPIKIKKAHVNIVSKQS